MRCSLPLLVLLLLPAVALADDPPPTDADGDGHETPDDCDDADPAVHPWAPDACGDGLDSDCSGADALADVDADDDGFLPSGAGCGADGLDCNDGNGDVSPGADERCGNLVDEDCSGAPGDDLVDVDGDGSTADGLFCDGLDCDDGDATLNVNDVDGDGQDSCDGDCDDTEATVYPGMEELCGDALDNDCSTVVDDRDDDGDGAYPPDCGGLDCDDQNAALSPLNPEADAACLDRVDNDCDLLVDGGDSSCFAPPTVNAGTDQQDKYLGGTLIVVLDGGASSDPNYDDVITYTWVLDTDVSVYPGVTATVVQDPASPVGFLRFNAPADGAVTEWSFDLHLVVADDHGGVSDPAAPEARTTVVIARPLWVAPSACHQGGGALSLLALLPGLRLLRRRR